MGLARYSPNYSGCAFILFFAVFNKYLGINTLHADLDVPKMRDEPKMGNTTTIGHVLSNWSESMEITCPVGQNMP